MNARIDAYQYCREATDDALAECRVCIGLRLELRFRLEGVEVYGLYRGETRIRIVPWAIIEQAPTNPISSVIRELVAALQREASLKLRNRPRHYGKRRIAP